MSSQILNLNNMNLAKIIVPLILIVIFGGCKETTQKQPNIILLCPMIMLLRQSVLTVCALLAQTQHLRLTSWQMREYCLKVHFVQIPFARQPGPRS